MEVESRDADDPCPLQCELRTPELPRITHFCSAQFAPVPTTNLRDCSLRKKNPSNRYNKPACPTKISSKSDARACNSSSSKAGDEAREGRAQSKIRESNFFAHSQKHEHILSLKPQATRGYVPSCPYSPTNGPSFTHATQPPPPSLTNKLNTNPTPADQRSSILSQILLPEAADRLGRIRLVKESRATDIENRLIMLARTGQLRQKVTEEQLKEILGAVAEAQEKDEQKIVVNRRGGGWDDDDDELEELMKEV
ncbi:DsDNA-binding protein PDCD5 [Pyrenophora tritici-repentis]|nr:DsDNA-binding protein PDCD5 [Pyrenophora tritici-repentis]